MLQCQRNLSLLRSLVLQSVHAVVQPHQHLLHHPPDLLHHHTHIPHHQQQRDLLQLLLNNRTLIRTMSPSTLNNNNNQTSTPTLWMILHSPALSNLHINHHLQQNHHQALLTLDQAHSEEQVGQFGHHLFLIILVQVRNLINNDKPNFYHLKLLFKALVLDTTSVTMIMMMIALR